MARIVTLLLVGLALSACASKSKDVKASYVSPVHYQNFSCGQLAAEGKRVSQQAVRVAGLQDKNRESDAVVTGVAVVLFWPAVFALEGDGPTATELARLKGEMDAIENASADKKCNIRFRRS